LKRERLAAAILNLLKILLLCVSLEGHEAFEQGAHGGRLHAVKEKVFERDLVKLAHNLSVLDYSALD